MLFCKPPMRYAKLGLAVALFALLAVVEPILATTGRYTAQRKPRVTVMQFENTNAEAQQARYGQSVEAMLVTFLKRKSQFIVVERQKLGPVLKEWENNQLGMTNLSLQDSRAQEILEKIDGIILGSVTLLEGLPKDTDSEEATTQQASAPSQPTIVRGRRIEIDVKLLSRADGRIIAAVQRSGPVPCLRSIVERLGVALEREFLRPYYGKLTFKLATPENVQLYLTPVLMTDAMDEEKPPVERSATVHMGTTQDTLEPWMTDPTTYTVEDVLSGWYSIRLERPGYEGIGTSNRRWEVRKTPRGLEVFEGHTGKPLRSFPQETRRFLVRVDPLDVERVDGDGLGFAFRKKQGSLQPLVKRQYLDRDYGRSDNLRVMLIGEEGIELNYKSQADEYSEDSVCDPFLEPMVQPANHGPTYVAAGQTFDFDSFLGGKLIIENYQGELLPVGQYDLVVWEPHYKLYEGKVSVRNRDQNKVVRASLVRHTVPVLMTTTGPKASHHGILRGRFTAHDLRLNLDFEETRRLEGLPVDRYSVRTDIPGFGAWRHMLDLLPPVEDPPVYDPESDRDLPIRFTPITPELTEVRFKTRLTLAGRVETLGPLPNREEEDWYEDRRTTEILDRLLRTDEIKEDEYDLDGGAFADWTPTGALRKAFTPILRKLQEELENSGKVSQTDRGPDWDEFMDRLKRTEQLEQLDQREQLKILKRLDQLKERGQPLELVGTRELEPSASAEPTEKVSGDKESADRAPDLPEAPGALRQMLVQRLEEVDLLVLDGWDLQRLLDFPEVQSILAEFVETGGALVVFATEPGKYGPVLGVPLTIDPKRKRTRKLRLKPGGQKVLALSEIKQKVRRRRAVPRFDLGTTKEQWRVLAYGHRPGQPRILERGRRQHGGYVLVWGDHPQALQARYIKRVRQVHEVRRRIADRAMNWARFLMYRKYDDLNQAKTDAEEELRSAHGR